VQSAKAAAVKEAQDAAQRMIAEAREDAETSIRAAAVDQEAVEKVIASLREELAYWKGRAGRVQNAVLTMQKDILLMSSALPREAATMQLAVEGSLTRQIIERGADGMVDIVQDDDDWLPPIEDIESGNGAHAGRS
jgi:hypothetical protein